MTEKQAKFVKRVKEIANRNYDAGGDVIIETMSDEDILREFKTLKQVKGYCGLWVEQNLNARCGEDSDPQVEMATRFDAAEWS